LPSFAKLSGYRKQRGLYVKLIRKGTQWRGRVEGPIPRSAARGAILEEPAEGHGAALVSAAELPREDVLRRLRFRQGLPLRDAIGQVQEPEDDGETRKQEERVELQGGVRGRAAHAASDEAREQARHEGKLLPVNRVLVPVLVAVVLQLKAVPEEPRDDTAERGAQIRRRSVMCAVRRAPPLQDVMIAFRRPIAAAAASIYGYRSECHQQKSSKAATPKRTKSHRARLIFSVRPGTRKPARTGPK